ncbi:MAG: hypothetical protein LBG27_03320 [Spirochaetaceae bacterium]|jgi:hypothetical protein|nr:hypothetical protein [Spirochaetaceae bacterium]
MENDRKEPRRLQNPPLSIRATFTASFFLTLFRGRDVLEYSSVVGEPQVSASAENREIRGILQDWFS